MDLKQTKWFDRVDLIILVLTIVLFLGIGKKMPIQIYGDGDFHSETKALTGYLHGAVEWKDVHISKAPGPIFFYFIPYSLVKPGSADINYWLMAVIWTAFFMCISMLLLRRTGDMLFGKPNGNMVVFLSFLIPLHVYYGLGIRAESMAYISIIFLIYGWAKWRYKGFPTFYRSLNWWLMSFSLLFLVLARPNAIFIIPIIVTILVFGRLISWKEKASKPGIWASIGVFFIFFFIITGFVKSLPVPEKTRSQEDYFLFVAHQGRFQFRHEPFDWRYWERETRADSKDYQDWRTSYGQLTKEVESTHLPREEVYKKWIINDLKNTIGISIRQFFMKVIYGHTLDINSLTKIKFHIGPVQGKTLLTIFIYCLNIINIMLFMMFIYWMINHRNLLGEYWPLWVPWLAILVFNSIIYMEPRYMFPTRPEMLLLASPIMTNLARKIFPGFVKVIS